MKKKTFLEMIAGLHDKSAKSMNGRWLRHAHMVMIMALALLLAPMKMLAVNIPAKAGGIPYTAAEIYAIINTEWSSGERVFNFASDVEIDGPLYFNNGTSGSVPSMFVGLPSVTTSATDRIILNGNGAKINTISGNGMVIAIDHFELNNFEINGHTAPPSALALIVDCPGADDIIIQNNQYNLPTGNQGISVLANVAYIEITGNTFTSVGPGAATRPLAINPASSAGPGYAKITGNFFYGDYISGLYMEGDGNSIIEGNTFGADFTTSPSPAGATIGGPEALNYNDVYNNNTFLNTTVELDQNGTLVVESYLVQFDVISGSKGLFSTPNNQRVLKGAFAVDPANPSTSDVFYSKPPNFNFVEWQFSSSLFDISTTPITAPLTLVAVWDNNLIQASIKVSGGNGTFVTDGWLGVDGNYYWPSGSNVTITAVPASGYWAGGWVVNGTPEPQTGRYAPLTLTRTAVASDMTVQLQFVTITYEPRLVSPTEMTVYKGYAATSTPAFVFSGTAPITVTKFSGDDKITWNSATRKLDIAEGLPVGVYEVVLTATNEVGSNKCVFTLTVEDVVYYLDIPKSFPGGTLEVITDVPYLAAKGEKVTLIVTPDPGFTLESITVYAYGNTSIVIPLTCTGDTCTFIMPGYHVSIAVVFTSATAIDNLAATGLKAYAQNSVLYISGLTPGTLWNVYNSLGTLVSQGMASADKTEVTLPGRGVYIVTDGNSVVKINN